MEKLLRNKTFAVLIVLLFLANLATLAIFWIGRLRPDAPQQGGAKAFVIRELDLTTAQQGQYDDLVKEHREKSQVIRRQIKDAKEEMFSLLRQQGADSNAKRNAARKVSLLIEELDLSTLDHFQKLRAICSDVQREKFDRIINKIIGEMGPQGGRPGPPPGPGGEGRPRPGSREDHMPPPGEGRPERDPPQAP